jgi:hypothetical protein
MNPEVKPTTFMDVVTLHPSSVKKASEILASSSYPEVRKFVEEIVMGKKPQKRGYCPECGRELAYRMSDGRIQRHMIESTLCPGFVAHMAALPTIGDVARYQQGDLVKDVRGHVVSKAVRRPSQAPAEPQEPEEIPVEVESPAASEQAADPTSAPATVQPTGERPDPARTYTSEELEEWIQVVREEADVEARRLRSELNKANGKLGNMTKKFTVVEQELAEIQAVATSRLDQIEALSNGDSANEEKVRSLTDQLTMEKLSGVSLQDRVRELEDQITQASTPDVRELEAQVEKITAERDSLNRQVEDLMSEGLVDVSDVVNQNARLKDVNDELDGTIKAMQREMDHWKSLVDPIANSNLRSELDNYRKKLQEANAEVDRRSTWLDPSQANALVQAERDRIRRVIG